MKKAASLLLCAALLLSLSAFTAQADIFTDFAEWVSGPFIEPFEAAETPAPTPEPTPSLLERISVPADQVRIPTPSPTPFNVAQPITEVKPGDLVKVPVIPAGVPTKKPTAKPTAKPPAGEAPPPAATAKPTARTQPQAGRNAAGRGAVLTSFGLYFEELRPKLTDTWYMFTPLDVGADSVLSYPLVANNASIVGSVRITVQDGTLVVDCLPADGVQLGRAFFTLFPNLDAIQTLNVDLLGAQAYAFGQPIDIARTFGEDRKVILYVNSTADFKANLPGITSFVPDQHRLFMQNLLPLLD